MTKGTIAIQPGVCQGYANCVVNAPDYFDLSDDGEVVLLEASVPEADMIRVTEAVGSCPVAALVMMRDEG